MFINIKNLFKAVNLKEFVVFQINNRHLRTENRYVSFNQLEEGVHSKIYCVFFCHVLVQAFPRADTPSIAPHQIKSIAIKSWMTPGFKFDALRGAEWS